MKTSSFVRLMGAAVLGAVALSGCQQFSNQPAADPDSVQVEFKDMDRFTDFSDEPWGNAIRPEDAAAQFREAVVDEARRHLREGQRLKVVFTDVDLAGDHLPSIRVGATSVRVVKELYPPRIKLTFTLTDANGTVLKQGERNLIDRDFLMRADISIDRSLRYDLHLLRDWLRSELR
ncbi:DUF3016 domain-containing protein [Opitutus terrae]|uniref:DUF3016 domain-containing protein n=1 Tax=Opitutus terrae (strain DSM 11246 / JCM 15787 / PB90-1) TaxID=452637 RepID=B1ZN25_OPITP|nr:DUF3016 domain-containing protein [Opitutus terrae]ACB76477.1 conserved hypothetical protein [Opitutus terrae PB90-1]